MIPEEMIPKDPDKIDTSPNPESVRLFKSDFLEFFTHLSPWVIVIFWAPVIVLLLVASLTNVSGPGFPWYIPLGFLIGLVLWSLVEYLLHRYLFHYHPKSPRLKTLFFLFHGVHHYQPQDKTRLVMPLPVSIPLGVVFYGIFYLVAGQLLGAAQWVNPLMLGFTVGYLVYDLIHYATHHLPMRSKLGKYLKRHHMAHHYKDPDNLYGVSSPLWDVIFRTMKKQKQRAK